MTRRFFELGAVSALLAVPAGAFGAHALRARLVPDMQTVFETGARYHMYHALALFVTAGAFTRRPGGRRLAAGRPFRAGPRAFFPRPSLLPLPGRPLPRPRPPPRGPAVH